MLVNSNGPWADFNKGLNFELAAPTSYKDFCRLLWFSISIVYFNLIPASKSVRLAWKQHVLIVPYGAEFGVLWFLSKTYLRISRRSTVKPCVCFSNVVFLTQINVLFIKNERLVTLVEGNNVKSTDPPTWHIASRFPTHHTVSVSL